jgi:Lon protease-like protein
VPVKPRVRFVRAAESELYGSADRYNEERAGRGDDFLRVVRAAVEEIAEAPGRWPRGPHAQSASSAASLSPFTTASTPAKSSSWRSPTRNAGPATGRADAEQPGPTQPR